MSIRRMTEVWESDLLRDSRKVLVCLALADWSNDEGWCWPKMDSIAKRARCSLNTARRLVQELERAGMVEVERHSGRHQVNRYRLHIGIVPPVTFELKPTTDESISTAKPPNVMEDIENPKPPKSEEKPPKSSRKPTSNVGGRTHEPLEPSVIQLPPWMPTEVWDNFKTHRAANYKRHGPLTEAAERIALKKLTKLRDEGHDPIALVEEAIVRGWASIFAPKESSNGTHSKSDRLAETLRQIDKA